MATIFAAILISLEMRNDHKTVNINARHVEYNIIEHFAAFCRHFVLLHGKYVKKKQELSFQSISINYL